MSQIEKVSESPVTRCRILRIAFISHVTDLTDTNPKTTKNRQKNPQKNTFYGRDKRVHRKHRFLAPQEN